MWTFIHKLGSPKWSYQLCGRLQPCFWVAAVLLLAMGSVWSLIFSPPDYQMGDSYRIIDVHVPAAILAQSVFVTMAVASVVFLVWKIKIADMAAWVMAPFGAAMTFLGLFSGALWGIPTWGTWWTWDARLTSMLIQLFIYIGVISLRSAFSSTEQGAKAVAVLTLVGVVNIPIIKYSVVWWNTLHQPATFTLGDRPAMAASMWMPLLLMVLGFYCFFIALTLYRLRSEILKRESRTRWVQELVK
ncbi:heme ABC transporter permease [Chromohalobacter japonicus]|uniref:heme ABC transporter permease n=1 Tax=Chromohalobacter japonicus TaxID=223900 RepID=UPI001FF53AE8|nr:heme ABC transporter permease [Chromohalobacter japonicus]MCK0754293.1 heme ABC transporter permease [Chromohalobacter japonicus]